MKTGLLNLIGLAGFGFKSNGLSKEDDGFSKGGRGVKRQCVREEGKYGSGLEGGGKD